MKMPEFMKEIFRSCRISEAEIRQIENAVEKTRFFLNEKRISRKKAIELCGVEVFWSGMERSAFHWSAVRDCEAGIVYFDSRKFFTE